MQALWSDILKAAQRDERQRVHDLIASTIMTDDDLVALFGAPRAQALAPRYRALIGRFANQGAMELVARVLERGYDDIEVQMTGTGGNAAGSPVDQATLAVLSPGVRVYAVRVKKQSERLGLRYDFFVYRRGRWLTGNLLGKYLVDVPDGGLVAPRSLPD